MREELRTWRDNVQRKLKAFQRSTVARIDRIFRDAEHPQNRVLVADEVGLGKTLIAKGVIANMAILRDEEGDDLFKVVYVCSNQTIARQNIGKLRVSENEKDNRIDNSVAETRLSMQHLRVLEQERECKDRNVYIQLTPLTPGTSFQISNSQGSASERALMYCVLSRKVEQKDVLSKFLRCDVGEVRWNDLCQRFEERIVTIRQSSQDYPEDLFPRMDAALLEELKAFLANWDDGKPHRELIVKLRRMFTEISAEMLQPDLVIMDEFQRFQTLLNPQNDDDLRTITEKFLRCGSEVRNRPRVLLLSATPYKLYSTLDEIDEAGGDEHYREFMEVVDFLLDHDPARTARFQQVWREYSRQLCQWKQGTAMALNVKDQAESSLYDSGMCRTERISFVSAGDYLVSCPESLTVCDGDVLAYMELSRILEKLHLPGRVPCEFAKSSPYLLSFMDQYKLKQEVESKLTTATAKEAVRGKGTRSLVWLRRDVIDNYGTLPAHHAKLECLRRHAFNHNGARLLWVPPSMPWYAPQGVYAGAENFSKLLIFSSWEMVPRMIASLISYDAECRTNGKLCRERCTELQKAGTRRGMISLHYFNGDRFPQKRLFRVREKGQNATDYLAPEAEFLRVHSVFLTDCCAASGNLRSLDALRAEVREKISGKLAGMTTVSCPEGMDLISALVRILDGASDPASDAEVRPITPNALDVLTDMAIAAPGICVVRSLRRYFPDVKTAEINEAAGKIVNALLRTFDSPEGIGAVADSCADLENYERKVLQYCVDGNFQAMFDEYCFLQTTESRSLANAAENICNALQVRTATYDVPTWESTAGMNEKGPLKMRSHYAVGFNKSTKSKGDSDTQMATDRKESIRTAFNSPFRPFVLASTSVGQEGLDFHYYCRRIMHWNLPGNPTELEQREGRINRYLCLAVRNSMVRHFRAQTPETTPGDWAELLKLASEEAERNNSPYSEITPFWCFRKDQPVKIERLVPLYPFSRDEAAYARLLKLLSLYRLTMGQARQEELLNAILNSNADADFLTKELFISLCSFRKEPREK